MGHSRSGQPCVYRSPFHIATRSRCPLRCPRSFFAEHEADLSPSLASQLFFVDVPPAGDEPFVSAFPDSADEASETESPPPPPVVKSKNLRQAVWFDPADEQLTVSLKDVSRLRKLRTSAEEDVVSGLDYEGRLRRQ